MSLTATPRDLIPEAHCVFGTFLRPFSLGHHLLFDRCGLPFHANPDADVGPELLALGVFLCAGPATEMLETIVRGELDSEFARWLKAIRPRWWRRRFDAEDEAEKFSAYLADGYRRAPVWRHQGNSMVELSAPWECLLQCRLRANGFADVLDLYLPAAWYAYHTLGEISQLENLGDPAKWRKVFYTAQDHARLHPN